MAKKNTIELWKNRIKEREQSGMYVDDWCKVNNFERHTYYYWYKKIKATKSSEKETKKNSTKKSVEKQVFAKVILGLSQWRRWTCTNHTLQL